MQAGKSVRSRKLFSIVAGTFLIVVTPFIQVGLDLSREGLQCLPTNVIHRKLQNYLVLVAYV